MDPQTEPSSAPDLLGSALLLHADEPVGKRPRTHALEWVRDPREYLPRARQGEGSPWTQAAVRAGVPFAVVRHWPDCTRAWMHVVLLSRIGYPRMPLVGFERYCPLCLEVPTALLRQAENHFGGAYACCYLLHFSRPVGDHRLRHYVGYSTDLPQRLLQHRTRGPYGAKVTQLARSQGARIRLGAVWVPGSLVLEKELQRRADLSLVCWWCRSGERASIPALTALIQKSSTSADVARTGVTKSGTPPSSYEGRSIGPGRPWTKVEDSTLLRAYRDGASIERLAELHGRKPYRIRRRLRHLGISLD